MSDAPPVQLAFGLGEHGWADISIMVGAARYDTGPVSWTTDALGDLLRGALLITTGQIRAAFSFDFEPQECRWVLECYEGGEPAEYGLRIRVLGFNESYPHESDEQGAVMFNAHCDPRAFGHAASAMARDVLAKVGAERYAAEWNTAFPLRALVALETALGMPKDG